MTEQQLASAVVLRRRIDRIQESLKENGKSIRVQYMEMGASLGLSDSLTAYQAEEAISSLKFKILELEQVFKSL